MSASPAEGSSLEPRATGPLAGCRVVELVGLGPAPFCGMMLADLGAEVLRIDQRRKSAFFEEARFDVLARGRSTLELDLKKPEDVATALDVIARADALIEGFRPGVLERLGLGPEVCLARQPRLVYGRVTGWGQTGPLASTAGHDLNYLALTGALQAIGAADRPPPPPLNAIADFGGGGMLLAFGIVCGILEARTSGRGQVIDAAMVDGVALLSAVAHAFRAAGTWSNERGSNFLDGGAPFYANYTCADGKFVSVGAIEPQFYARLLDKLELPEMLRSTQNDRSTWPALRAQLTARFVSQPRDHWTTLFDGVDACVAPVLDWDEAQRHPHALARDAYVTIDGVIQPAPAPRFSATPPRVIPPRAPAAILADWGVDRKEPA